MYIIFYQSDASIKNKIYKNEIKTDTIIFTGSFDYQVIFITGNVIIPVAIYDSNVVVHPFTINNNHKVLFWYSWYYEHHKTTDGKETTDTTISLFFAQNSENYSYTIQEVNTITYFILI